MVHNNKVLTVSYGTFSCTLEGFDDSFGTMKAIAEYFRDLSSDDRYFGSEPPQPDAEMLARIAQREIARQVEAHSTGTGGIVLRATDAANVAAVVAAPEPKADPAPEAVSEIEPEVEAPAEVAPVITPEPVVTTEALVEPEPQTQPEVTEVAGVVNAPEPDMIESTPVTEPVADSNDDDLAEVEATEVVAPTKAEAPVEAPEMVPETDVVAAPDQINSVDAEVDAPIIADDAPLAETPQVEMPVETDDVLQDDTPEELVIEPIGENAPTPDAEPNTLVAETVSESKIVPAADSIAAKLQRIRAVVSQSDSLAPMDEYTEDEDTDGFVTAQVHNINEAQTTDEEPLSAPVDSLDAIGDIMNVQTQPGAIGAQPDEEPYEVEEDIFSDIDTDQDQSDTIFDDPDAGDELISEALGDEAATGSIEDDIGETGPDAIQARVLKVKRVDLEAVIAAGQLEQFDGDDIDTGAVTEATDPQEDSSLSPEDEDDLMRELAAVEEELNFAQDEQDEQEVDDNIFGDDIVSEVADALKQDPELDDETQNALSQTVSENEVDLSRLMEAADEKLDDPETSSSRDTYSHLRAAAAAAEAEKSAGGSIEDKTQDDAYRDDLANVVRPRRTAIEGNRPARRVPDARPAPLKLVAEQRVDEGASQVQRGTVRPRRVMTAPSETTNLSDATGADSAFADFAERVGATELPDLLEAAAAYLSFVEGQEKFSRPQLMNKVRLVKQDDYNREDGLRSFGQLLRDGKIEKRGGGRFAASQEIGFRPDNHEREAG